MSREVSMNLLTLIANSPSFSISRSFLPLFSFSPFTFFATVLSLSLSSLFSFSFLFSQACAHANRRDVNEKLRP